MDFPEKILTDQGCNFESDLLKALCEIAQVKKNQDIWLPSTNKWPKSTWREQVPTLVHAYNCTRNNATGFSPYYLMFGHKPCLPINLIFRTNMADFKGSSITYIENLKKRMV